MCIAIAKPMGIKLPSLKIMKSCFEANPHGGGFAYVKGGEVVISKGYFDVVEMYEVMRRVLTEDTSALIHFRLATQGSIGVANCHPFPVSENVQELQMARITSDMAVCHNGIIGISTEGDLSDTAMFTKEILASPYIKPYIFKSEAIRKLIEGYIGFSKLVFLSSTGEIATIGEFISYEGCLYSNWDFQESHWRSWHKSFLKEKKKRCICGSKTIAGHCFTCGLNERDIWDIWSMEEDGEKWKF